MEKQSPNWVMHAARKAAHMTIDELASRTGIPVSRLAAIEQGRRQMDLRSDQLLALARELNVSTDVLLSLDVPDWR